MFWGPDPDILDRAFGCISFKAACFRALAVGWNANGPREHFVSFRLNVWVWCFFLFCKLWTIRSEKASNRATCVASCVINATYFKVLTLPLVVVQILVIQLINPIEWSPSWETDSRWASQETSYLSLNPVFRLCTSPPLNLSWARLIQFTYPNHIKTLILSSLQRLYLIYCVGSLCDNFVLLILISPSLSPLHTHIFHLFFKLLDYMFRQNKRHYQVLELYRSSCTCSMQVIVMYIGCSILSWWNIG
jgi:hypothetical protein